MHSPHQNPILLIFSTILLILSPMTAHAQDTSLHDILIDGEAWQPAVTGAARVTEAVLDSASAGKRSRDSAEIRQRQSAPLRT